MQGAGAGHCSPALAMRALKFPVTSMSAAQYILPGSCRVPISHAALQHPPPPPPPVTHVDSSPHTCALFAADCVT
jgi:hypothetical protein